MTFLKNNTEYNPKFDFCFKFHGIHKLTDMSIPGKSVCIITDKNTRQIQFVLNQDYIIDLYMYDGFNKLQIRKKETNNKFASCNLYTQVSGNNFNKKRSIHKPDKLFYILL